MTTPSPLSPKQQGRVDKAAAKAGRPWVLRHWIITGAGAFIALLVVIGVASGGSSTKSKNASLSAPVTSSSSSSDAPVSPTTAAATPTSTPTATPTMPTPAATPTKTPPPAPAKPTLTGQQQQAVAAAQSYLSLDSGFSKRGLIEQLSSSAGDGFSVADATVAVNSLNIDYNTQAVLAAKGYLSLGAGFSHASMVEQLESSAGSEFTPAQAEYGADHDGS